MTNGVEYLRAGDIARLAGVSLRTVRRWIADPIFLSTKIGGARLVAKGELGRLLSPLAEAPEQDTEGDDE